MIVLETPKDDGTVIATEYLYDRGESSGRNVPRDSLETSLPTSLAKHTFEMDQCVASRGEQKRKRSRLNDDRGSEARASLRKWKLRRARVYPLEKRRGGGGKKSDAKVRH